MPCFVNALAALLTTQRLSAFDLALVAVYLIGITLFGLRFRKSRGTAASAAATDSARSLKSYFLADNTIPWWAIALSVVSAETSTLTIISIPGLAFGGDFGFLQVVIGYMIGRVVVAVLFLPRYFAGEMLTAYQLIDRRFGPTLHKVTAALFLVTRATAEGVRVFAVSIVVGIAIGTRDVLSIAIISALTLLYTFEGGMAAVVWTDVVQMIIYVGGTVVALLTLGSHVQGGWPVIHTVASAAGKFHLFNFALNLTTTYTFWAGVIGGTFLTMASHGTDQLMVQRLLAARNLRQSTAALLSSGVVIFMQFALFLLIGAGLYVFYQQHPGATFRTNDYIFPTFIVREMPIGIAGLLVAAILAAAMSNLSAALNSLSSTTVVDFYMRLRPRADDRERALIAKSSTVLWALVLFAIAVYSVHAGGKGHVVEIGLSIASVAYGCLLGVFLLGTLTRFATESGAIIGMICGFVLNLWIWQGAFPVHLGPITIPHIAWTWYVLIGAAATFLIGGFVSLFVGKRVNTKRRAVATAALLALLFLLPFPGVAQKPATHHKQVQGPPLVPAPDFSTASKLINDAIAEHHLPGAVLLIGHSGRIVFEHAYGNRKLAGEPGLNGRPSPAERMTENTIFDMASLSKCLSTATSIMQLYEQGKLGFDEPVQQLLPDFNSDNDPERAKVTVRMLLTHTSGEPADVNLKDPWGLASPDKAEGIHRALTTPLQSAPAEFFRYSDINFILLGDIVETLSGEPLDVYAQEHIFKPLGMTETRYLPLDKACGPHKIIGAAIAWAPAPHGHAHYACPAGDWSTGLLPRIAPTTHDDESKSDPSANPHFDMLTRGTVHDPTTRRMGGVAGHAGVFSTAHDISLFAQALLDRLAGRPSNFPLKQSTLELMTIPEQPDHHAGQLEAATQAEQYAIAQGEKGAQPGLAPRYPAIHGQDLRGFGWDIDTAFSKPRGMIFPIGSFGHTGFTGTSLWMDPGSDTYVILLANAIHPRGNAPISNLRGEVATAAARALFLYGSCSVGMICDPVVTAESGDVQTQSLNPSPQIEPEQTLTGIDVLESDHFAELTQLVAQHNNSLHLGILTNQSGVDAHGHRTIDILSTNLPKVITGAKLTAIFSPEHGIFGKRDTTSVGSETDATTGLRVTSLYGPHDADKRPSHDQLKDLDAIIIDLQDAGVRTYTYETVTGYFLEAAAREQSDFQHTLNVVVLDRPNPINGLAVQGPVSDPGHENYTDYGQIPVRHGMTLGELARFYNGTKHIDAPLTVVALQHWTRSEFYDQTGLPWINPSPNLHELTANILLPGLTMLEATNATVGRGTPTPFELIGAGLPPKDKATGAQPPAWFRASDVVAALTARHIPGVTFTPTTTTVDNDPIHPYHGQTIQAVRINVTDRDALNSPELGVELLSALHKLYPDQFRLDRAANLLASQPTLDAITRGDDPHAIAANWQPALAEYKTAREQYLLYK